MGTGVISGADFIYKVSFLKHRHLPDIYRLFQKKIIFFNLTIADIETMDIVVIFVADFNTDVGFFFKPVISGHLPVILKKMFFSDILHKLLKHWLLGLFWVLISDLKSEF